MKARNLFDLARTPLPAGATLIEASAGTGKTFTIAGIFLRLILESDFPVREILVVTFTEAATEELRGRIRERLAEAAAAFVAGGATDDEVLREILRPHLPKREEMIARLDRALSGFDEAPIFTIHGFCQRTLRDRAFESGALFDTELLKDDSRLLEEIADDFWRRHFYEASPLPVQFLLKNKYQPASFLPLLRIRNRHPALRVISQLDSGNPVAPLDRLTASFNRAQDLWRKEAEAIRSEFGDGATWAKGPHYKQNIANKMWTALAACFDEAVRTPDSLEALDFFAQSALDAASRTGATAPQHPFFQLCDEVGERRRDYLTGLHLEFLEFAVKELPRRKQGLKVQSFDDLLTRLHAALHSPGGRALAAEVRAQYRAALIDEFQDTDPVQWGIFRRLFADTREDAMKDTSPAPLLFLIGDPKQAIYGFRGADIFTYLDAATTAERSHTLGRNFRSESGLVRAVNTVFSAVKEPFLFEEIHFQNVDASERADQTPLLEDGQKLPPLHLWFMPRGAGSKDITKAAAESILPNVVASEIARLINSDTRLGEARLSPRDVAVLVPENRHARLMQEALRARSIPSVLHTEESVFASREAREMERVLAAIAQPADERLLRAALATELIGVNGAALDQLTRNESEWQRRMECFLGYHNVWVEKGFTPMFRRWLQGEQVRERLLRFSDGERRLTNVLHLGEVLHQAALEHRLGLAGLVRWLSEQINSEEKAAEEHQLRLERDDQAVKLVTIHKSKGLEYPIVFCPFSWKSSDTRRSGLDPVFFHERSKADATGHRSATQFICDLGSEDLEEHRQLAFAEKLAENLRLFYVALTRARHRCYFVWGAFRGAGTSATAWLFHPPLDLATNLQSSMTAHFKSLDDATMLAGLRRLVTSSIGEGVEPSIQLQTLPAADTQSYRPPGENTEALRARLFTGHIARDWRILSFSGLAANRREELPDYDATPDAEASAAEPAIEPQGIFAFPAGTKPGTCLHKIFEVIDFTQHDDKALRTVVDDKLTTHGFAPAEFGEVVCDMVRRTLAVPLTAGRPDFTLARVPPDERLNELEFYFPIERLTPSLLQAGFASAGSAPEFLAQLERLDFRAVDGFVKGFIDLVFRFEDRFYIVDWKSNRLGPRGEDYRQEALAREMAEKFYTLQYHLYTVALHRYLKLRLRGYDYERHFGGVRYLFLRGLDPTRPALGVFTDRPAATFIDQLSAQLTGKAEDVAP